MKIILKLALAPIICICLFSCSSDTEDQVKEKQLEFTEKSIASKQIEIEIIEEINAYRITKGLSTLKTINIVKQVANTHTDYMIENGKLSHENFKKRSDYLIKNTNASRVGENVAYGYKTAKKLVKAWVKSDSHRKTIEGEFSHFDISAEQSEKGVWFFTNIFIRK